MQVQDTQRRQQIRQMFSAISPMLLKGRFAMAYEYYNLRGGRELAPELEGVFATLQDIPYTFAKQWKERIGQTAMLTLQKAPAATLSLLINDVIGNTVYATDTQTRQAYTFTVHDLTPEDQQ